VLDLVGGADGTYPPILSIHCNCGTDLVGGANGTYPTILSMHCNCGTDLVGGANGTCYKARALARVLLQELGHSLLGQLGSVEVNVIHLLLQSTKQAMRYEKNAAPIMASEELCRL
jgi:hypothetical protein